MSAFFLVLAAHSFIFYPLSLIILRRFRRRPLGNATPPAAELTFSVCVCAHNEAGVIRDKVANLLAVRERTPNLEILVYDDASSDGTTEILREFQDQLTLVVSRERTGKTVGMNRLVSMSHGGIVVFSDANVMIDPDALANLGRYFADPEVGCVCGHLKYLNGDQSVTAKNGSDYWRLEEFIKQLESDTGSVVGADGSLFAVRRSLHRPVPEDLIDDLYVSMSVLLDGYRVVRGADVLAFEDSAPGARDEFRRKIRIACQAFNVHGHLWPRIKRLDLLNLYKYVSHKPLRWATIYSVLLAAVFLFIGVAGATDWRVASALMAVAAGILALGQAFRIAPIYKLVDGLIVTAGTGIGLLYSIRGKRFQTWTPVASIRGAK
ncbi:MAG TPA: glycosyltransferase [Geminicoccaceae bacterium]|nr:glycosyltransferase [Geminicoccaceae bacterium]